MKERKDIMMRIQELIKNFDMKVDDTIEMHILQQIEACINPDKLLNPSRIKVVVKRNETEDVEEFKRSGRCPLTQAEIEDEYASTCGHRFERKAIMDEIRRSSKTCPVIGCGKQLSEKKN
ncbi:hypothetical protein ECANGB1_1631 [Enterospora canceri]|uniref:SP-RING-type domain-containing protein n=1 Tax=Enterospora canceri TaxID=1081671 RepID=A0A1Y1S5M5_9MICR|nr:hypothetical protein ECANGB1_1631 [Enterospora canceri]